MRFRSRRPGLPEIKVGPGAVPGSWEVGVVARDKVGLLAAIAGAFASNGLDIVDAAIVTSDDGLLSDRFVVRSSRVPNERVLQDSVIASWLATPEWTPVPDATIAFHQGDGSTMCEIRAADRPGLLHDLAAACASVGVSIQGAKIATQLGAVHDRFELVDRRGRPLDSVDQDAVRTAITGEGRLARSGS